jgi:hypothetical protein
MSSYDQIKMNTETDKINLLGRQIAVTLFNRDGGYIALEAESGVFGEAETVDAALDQLRDKMANLERIYLDAGFKLDGSKPRGDALFERAILPFAWKAIIVTVLLSLALTVLMLPVAMKLEKASIYAREAVGAGMAQLSSYATPHALSETVQVIADTLEQITPERRDELRENFARISRALRPYREELEPLITLEVDPRAVNSAVLAPVDSEKSTAQ